MSTEDPQESGVELPPEVEPGSEPEAIDPEDDRAGITGELELTDAEAEAEPEPEPDPEPELDEAAVKTLDQRVRHQEQLLARQFPHTKDGVRKVVARIKVRYPEVYVTSTTSGVHAPGSFHYQGRAFDLASHHMDDQGRWITQNLRGVLAEGIHNGTLSVKNGRNVGAGFWGAQTWGAHRSHIHVAV